MNGEPPARSRMPPEDVLRRRAKNELRKRMRGLRMATPAAVCAERSARIVERLRALPPVATARSVALFWPVQDKHEVDLRPLLEPLRARGARVALPCARAEAATESFRFFAPGETLIEEAPGLLAPSAASALARPGEIDAIVVPALAFDPRGHRIGYGGGFYDRALPAFAPPATTVAVAFDFQLIVEVPDTEGDVAVGFLVTDVRALVATPSA
jgi:5-formyltetrahydrofolate cyclo-ligase